MIDVAPSITLTNSFMLIQSTVINLFFFFLFVYEPKCFAAIEVRKLERRKWFTPGLLREKEDEKILPLNLPVPSKSPSILNMVPDFKSKKLFLRLLGLKNVNTDARQGSL